MPPTRRPWQPCFPRARTQVDGTLELSDRTGADLFAFGLATPATLTIQMISSDFDANLLLYNGLGQGLAGDDDDDSACAVAPPNSLDSCLTLALAAGNYFLAAGENNIGSFESEADFLASVTDFMDNDFGILSAPTLEILGFAGFEGGLSDPDGGAYTLTFSEILVPEPGTLWVLTVSALGLARLRRAGSRAR